MGRIVLEQVTKRFGDVEVIPPLDLTIEDGEFAVFVGPSGCGKSTLLRMVAGLETVSDGEVRIGERRVNELEPMDRDISMVFQNYALYPHMTVRQNIGYGLKIAKTPKDQIEAKVRQAAELLQLSDYLDRRPRDLSGGQRQRVAMGRAIVREPAAFLFDEPLSNLDAKLRVQMRLEIKSLQSKLGVTALYVTHDQVEAMTMADRMVVMHAGKAEQIGTPLEVYERPQTVFGAQFIGSPSMNVLPGRAEGGRVTLGQTSLAAETPASGPVMVGVRPEHVHADPDGPVALDVQLAEPLGANTLLHGRLAGSGETFTVALPGVHRAGAGDRLTFSVPPGQIHLFDPQSRARL